MEDYLERLVPRARRFFEMTTTQIGMAFLRDTAVGLIQAYRASWGYAYSNFDPDEAHDVCGHIRKAHLETLLKYQAGRHGLRASTARNKRENYSHTEVRGHNVVVTAARSTGPYKMVPAFDYRQELAESSQLTLRFDLDEPIPAKEPTEIYGMILHGPLSGRLYMPAFIRLAFPVRDFGSYVANLDLLRICSLKATELLDPAIVEETIKEEFDLDVLDLGKTGSEDQGR